MDWADRISRRIKLRDLHVLRAAAETGTMVKAAVQLGTSHPVISKTMSDLEKLVGARLLERSVRGVELTGAGKGIARGQPDSVRRLAPGRFEGSRGVRP